MGYFRIRQDKLPLKEPLERKEETMFHIIQAFPGVIDWSPVAEIREAQRSLLVKGVVEYNAEQEKDC